MGAGALVGAFLGVGVAVVVSQIVLAGFLTKAAVVAAAVNGITGGLGAATTGVWVAGGIVAGAAAAGAIGGGIVGFQAVEDGDGICDAAKKAATANWENTKKVVAGAKGLVSELTEVITSNKGYNKMKNE